MWGAGLANDETEQYNVSKFMMVVAILLGCLGTPLAHAKATSEGESGVGSQPLPLLFRDLEDAKQICSGAKQICSAALNIDICDISELAGHPEHSIGEMGMCG